MNEGSQGSKLLQVYRACFSVDACTHQQETGPPDPVPVPVPAPVPPPPPVQYETTRCGLWSSQPPPVVSVVHTSQPHAACENAYEPKRRVKKMCDASHVIACQRCQAASRGMGGAGCQPRWGWNWKQSLQQNEQYTRLPGLTAWRGIDGVNSPGVSTVAKWNQSNWPGLLHAQPQRVRTATAADRIRLCKLWDRDHSYQSFPILLGCPGRAPREFEPLCGNDAAVVRIPCANVDLSSDPVTAGGIFDKANWFRVSHCTHPPKPCAGTRVQRFQQGVGVVMSVYPTGVGHFVPEQLPRVLLLHRHIPPEVPILVADSPFVRRYMEPLLTHGVLPPGRIAFHKLARDGTVIHADSVFTVLNSHFSNIMSGDATMLAARDLLGEVPPKHVPPAKRTHILVIDRSKGRSNGATSRSITNGDELYAALRRTVGEVARGGEPSTTANPNSLVDGGMSAAGRAAVGALEVKAWTPSLANLSADVAAFRQAAIIVAPHGAGLANLLFASPHTPIIEICYDDFGNTNAQGMACPAMYAAMATNLHLPYWVVTGVGNYATEMKADLRQLTDAVTQALREAYSPSRGQHGAASRDLLRAPACGRATAYGSASGHPHTHPHGRARSGK